MYVKQKKDLKKKTIIKVQDWPLSTVCIIKGKNSICTHHNQNTTFKYSIGGTMYQSIFDPRFKNPKEDFNKPTIQYDSNTTLLKFAQQYF